MYSVPYIMQISGVMLKKQLAMQLMKDQIIKFIFK